MKRQQNQQHEGFVDNFPWSNNKTGILKVQAAYINVSIWVPLLPSNCLNPFFPTFADCDVEICEKIWPEPFFILFVHPHATQCIGMMTDVKMSVEKMKFAKRQNFFLMCKGVIHFNANVFHNVNIANIYQVNIHS